MKREEGRLLPGLLLGLMLLPQVAAAEPAKLILALGDDSYIPADAVKAWTGAEVRNTLGKRDLLEFAVVILSNIPYGALPPAVREGLPEFVRRGGSLLITGGPNAYGSGGYQSVASLIPFEIRAESDWIAVPFKAVILLQPDHPILAGVTFQTVGILNDLNPKKSGAVEIARYAGGATFDPSGRVIGSRFPSPLIAEQRGDQGTVLGIALDVGREVRAGWTNGPRFLQNVLTYLVGRSPLKPRTGEELLRTFLRWQETCDRELRRGTTGGAHWKRTAADCRRELADSRYPYLDLADLWLVERLAIAERVERGELSEGDGGRQMMELNVRIRKDIERRQEGLK